MKKLSILLVLLISVYLSGCNESQRKQESKEEIDHSNQQKMEFLERMEKVYALYERSAKQNQIYKEMGLVKIVMSPSGGSLYIDGGLYGGSLKNEITLPVGVHEFDVKWSGVQRSKKVYVSPALNLAEIPDIQYHESGGRINMDINPKPRNLNVATVTFRK